MTPLTDTERDEVDHELAETRAKLERVKETPPLRTAKYRRQELLDALGRSIERYEGVLRRWAQ